jgi:hypothetical protein
MTNSQGISIKGRLFLPKKTPLYKRRFVFSTIKALNRPHKLGH